MKFFLVLKMVVLLVCLPQVYAQKSFSLGKGDKLKLETQGLKIGVLSNPSQVVHIDEAGGIYMAYSKFQAKRVSDAKNNLYFEWDEELEIRDRYSRDRQYLAYFSPNGKVKEKNKVKIKDKRQFLSFFHDGEKIYLLSYFANSDKQKVYFFREEIDMKTLKVKHESIKPIFAFDLPSDNLKGNDLVFNYRENKDSEPRFMVHMLNGKYDKKLAFSHSVASIDKSFNVVWKHDLIKTDLTKWEHYSFDIKEFDENGNLFLKTVEHPDLKPQSKVEELNSSNGRDFFGDYVCKLFVFYSKEDESTYDEHVIELPNGHKTGRFNVVSEKDNSGRFRILGSYSDFDYEFTKGFFILDGQIGEELESSQASLIELDLEIFLEVFRTSAGYASSIYSNDIEAESVEDEAVDLRFNSVFNHSDGSMTFVVEAIKKFKVRRESKAINAPPTVDYDASMAIYVFHVDKDGELSWQHKVPKPNHSFNIIKYGGVIATLSDGKLNLIYGYNKDNPVNPSQNSSYKSLNHFKKSKYILASFDLDGKASYKKIGIRKDIGGVVKTGYTYRNDSKAYFFLVDGAKVSVASITEK